MSCLTIIKMNKPIENIIKEYLPRGPLRQYRFEKSLSFSCFRCGQVKTSKLITIYCEDWSKKLCNGCYGRLLSIYEIKAGVISEDEKVEQLTEILLKLIDENKVIEETNRILLRRNQAKYLATSSIRFFATSESVAKKLTNENDLDWSPAIIGLCKAFEVELIDRIVKPLRNQSLNFNISETDLNDPDFGRIAKYCSGKSDKTPEIGVVNHFIRTAINSKERIETSLFLKDIFKVYLSQRPKSYWLIDKNGFINATDDLTKNFRNKAAHIDELSKIDYEKCKELVFGDKGIIWELIICTDKKK